MEGFRFSTNIDVRFSETDAQGIVHNAAYLIWFEIARIAYIEQHPGGYIGLVEAGTDVTTAAAFVHYRLPCRFGDRLRLLVRVRDVRKSRFRFEYVIERDGDVVAEGWTDHACVDAQTLRPIRMPAGLRETIERIESDS